MNMHTLIQKRRTIRRFKQEPITLETLTNLADAGRLAPSGANLQPLEFILLEDSQKVNAFFQHTRWAAYLPKDSGRPPENQTPVAYIVVLINRHIRSQGGEHDAGAAVQSMILAALEQGIGSCWLGSLDRPAIKRLLSIPDHYDIDTALALGYPDETPVVEDVTDSIKYYLDKDDTLHVPKRSLSSILHHNAF